MHGKGKAVRSRGVKNQGKEQLGKQGGAKCCKEWTKKQGKCPWAKAADL